jgi:hypothetical protein
MHTTERQQVVSTMTVEPARALGVVLKCGVCLALLILLMVIGSAREDDTAAPQVRGSASQAQAVARLPAAAAHRKAVFDDRRARFEDTDSERIVAGMAPGAPAEPYAP